MQKSCHKYYDSLLNRLQPASYCGQILADLRCQKQYEYIKCKVIKRINIPIAMIIIFFIKK